MDLLQQEQAAEGVVLDKIIQQLEALEDQAAAAMDKAEQVKALLVILDRVVVEEVKDLMAVQVVLE
jgi:hypothetical protein